MILPPLSTFLGLRIHSHGWLFTWVLWLLYDIFKNTSYIPPNPRTLLLLTVASWPSILSPPLSPRPFHPPVASSFAYSGMCQIVLLLRTLLLVSASPCHVLLQLIMKYQNVTFITVTLPGHLLNWLEPPCLHGFSSCPPLTLFSFSLP